MAHSKIIPLILAPTAAMLLAGCETITSPKNYTDTWTSPTLEDKVCESDNTWKNIRSQKIDSSKPLTLSELVDIALNNSPATRQYWYNAKANEAVVGQNQSAYYPSATISADLKRQKTNDTVRVNNVNYSMWGPNLQLSYLLLDFGGRSANLEQAYQNLLNSNFQYNQSIQDLLQSVAKAYYDFYSSQSALDAALSDTLDAKISLNATKIRLDAGLVTELDVLQSRSQYNKSLYNLESAKGRVQTSRANLANSIGFPADADFSVYSPRDNLPTGISKRDVTKMIDNALIKRPDIASYRASVLAQAAAVKSANSALWPSLNFTGNTDKMWREMYNANDSHENEYEFIGFLSVSWDVFDGFNNLNKKRQAQAQYESLLENLRLAELAASSDVWTKYYNYRTDVKNLAFSRAYYDSSKSSYDLAIKGYDAGIKSILDVLQAQSQLSDARSQVIQSKKNVFYGIVDLAHATGVLNTQKIQELKYKQE